MTAAALTIEPPPVLRDIYVRTTRARLRELESRASQFSEELELAKLFEADNERLEAELAESRREAARQAARADVAEHGLEVARSGVGAKNAKELEEESSSPTSGEIRYYKKTRSTGPYDVMVRVADCGHNVWQPGHKGDKAKKGIERLEGSSDWRTATHCGACTGGGVWKVAW